MSGTFAYSYNGENYRGAFATREEAAAAGLRAIGGLDVLPQTIFVGRMVAANVHAQKLGRAVVGEMRARAADNGVESDGGFLARVTPDQLRALDAAIECTVLGWLQKSDLAPRQFRVDSISEHPVPPVPQVRSMPNGDEVSDLGTVDEQVSR